MMHIAPHVDISAAEQASLNHLTVPELSPSDPNSNASSPASSEPVTPVDPPSLAAPPDPLVDGKHQPAPRPYRPIAKAASRGTVWRARQVLFSLGKRKRQPSEDAGISADVGVQVLDSDDDGEEALDSPAETPPATSQVRYPLPITANGYARDVTSQSLFNLPNVSIDGTPPTQARPRLARSSLTRRSTHDTLASASATPALRESPARQPPPGAPWTPPALAAVARVLFFVPWCVAVGAAIVLYPRALTRLVRLYAAVPPTPLHRLAYHAHTAGPHVCIFAAAVCLAAAALPGWLFRAALLGAVGVRAAVVARGFKGQIEGRGDAEGPSEEWREDARCVWRVLRGEEEREILRACAGGGAVKEE
ncbi:hypothetical protein EDB92DRAFT_2116395 [Lactarius akahatsu]|uniref:Uncharacterized protein n=1 Tax=Lactarius akahatsu TaxID=416441 RepID=A0AAD4Q5P6_9AGAM|nr:hypothetical protein EDB92DRAFT_2116395 [Lactarius akahatsu]